MGKSAASAPEKVGPYHRLRCVCCGCPTLDGPSLERFNALWPQDCVLCDWENAGPSQTAIVDDYMSLAQARANVERFSWMYDPDALPDWLPHRPSTAELHARATLRQCYRTIDQDRNGSESEKLWRAARDAEVELRSLVDARTSADVDEAEENEASIEEVSDAEPEEDDDSGVTSEGDADGDELDDPVSPAEIHAGAMAMDAVESSDVGSPAGRGSEGVATTTDASSPSSGRALGPFDYAGPPRGSAVIAGITSSNSERIAAAVLRALDEQRVMLYGSGFVGDRGAPHVIAVLPTNAPAGAAEAVQSFLLEQPGVLGAYVDRRDGAALT
jgi:hypothetical protein